MRYSPDHKAQTRLEIIEVASRALREHGISGVSVASIMKRAGLTHGGFYAHFNSRDELIAEAVLHAAHKTGEATFRGSSDMEDLLRRYLSRSHMDERESGCVVAALGAVSGYQNEQVEQAFEHAARGLIDLVAHKLEGEKGAQALPSPEALRLSAQMVGGLVLARMVRGEDDLATRMLEAIVAGFEQEL